MMPNSKIPIIPESYIKFAKDVVDLAEKAGISNFLLTHNPDSMDSPIEHSRFIDGNVQFHYSTKDGRGRPSKNLSVSFKTNVCQSIISSLGSW